MKELTIEQKARVYDEALARARKLQENSNGMILKKWLWNIFPELKESEDEKIRKWIIDDIKYNMDNEPLNNSEYKKKAEKAIAWLEKQSKQEESQVYETKDGEVITYSETNGYKIVETKFHEGDWVVTDKNNVVQIKEIEDNRYVLENTMKFSVCYVDKCWRKWNIRDAKDGDMLAMSAGAFIYNGNRGGGSCPGCYCGINTLGNFKVGVEHHWTGRPVFPATKEQRELLFQKMKEAGYTFDFEKKELKKIETEIEIPFGAKDSELQEATYYIPKGFHAEIDDDKVVIKKGEKHTAWSEESRKRIQRISDFIWKNRKGDTDDIYQQEQDVKWLKFLKGKVGCEANCTTTKEWSKEDEHRVKDTIYFLDTAKKHYASTVELDACIDWLKSLEDRVQPKQEWSAEDNSVLKDIKIAVASYWDEDTENIILDWLKSLKQRIGG